MNDERIKEIERRLRQLRSSSDYIDRQIRDLKQELEPIYEEDDKLCAELRAIRAGATA